MPDESLPMVICATARLARGLKTAYNRTQRARGLDQWQTLPALTLGQWLDGVLDAALLNGEIDAGKAPCALSALQERMLWERAISAALADEAMEALFDKSGMACAAQEANRLLIEQRTGLGDTALHEQARSHPEYTEETRQFMRWRETFRNLCRQAVCLESARYLDWQISCLQSGWGQLPTAMQLAGFDRITPQMQQLLDVLAQRGVQVSRYETGLAQPATAVHVALADREAECRAAAAWAQQQLARNPQARLAIVVPELATLRQPLAAMLDDVLHPATVMPMLAEAPRSYDFSLGLPLSAQPVIATALNLLRLLVQPRLSQTEFSALLLQPYWSASVSEADARARLDARMREWLPLTVSVQRILRFTQKSLEGERSLPVVRLADDLQMLVDEANRQPRKQRPSAWAGAFQAMLKAAHWPGERSLSSHEYQARKAFSKALQGLAEFDALLPAVNMGEALRCLDQLCQEQIFQAEVKGDPPLQVMGMLEAAAEPLAAVWVMGMNDHVWPPPPHPNPLLPAALQRANAMPNADSAVQAEFAAAIHTRLLHSAPDIVFSSALKDGDRQLRASPLVAGMPQLAEAVPLAVTLAEMLARDASAQLCFLPDHMAPPVAAGEHVSGGTGLLKAQAICPAWAYYQYRLGARQLETPLDGLEATERGTLVHSVLEHFWGDPAFADSHAVLQSAAPQILQAAVEQAADAALAAFSAKRFEALSPAFLALERERLARLVLAWLALETTRATPFRVSLREHKHTLNIEGVEIKLVIDRIDTLADGRLVLMDYKTGQKPDVRNWAETRMSEPQLPVYAALSLAAENVAAVCFGLVRTAEHGFAGIAAEAELLPSVSALDDKKARAIFSLELFPHWQALLAHWKTSTENIVRELKSGEAAVRFADEKQLAYCEVLPLLRLPERQLQFERRQAAGNTQP